MRDRQTFEWIKIQRSPAGTGELGLGGVRCSLKTVFLYLCLSPHSIPAPLLADTDLPDLGIWAAVGLAEEWSLSSFPHPSLGTKLAMAEE